MTIRSLHIFFTVAQFGSMSKAAEALFISQPSVSLAISEIEKEYNVLLFDRHRKKLHLTQTGEILRNYAKDILSKQEEMENFLNNESLSHRIRIGATVTVGACVISTIIAGLKESIPNFQHEVLVANTRIIEDKIMKSELDIGLVEGFVNNPSLEVKNAINDRLVCVCPMNHKFMGRKTIYIEELEDEPLVTREIGSGTRAQLEHAMSEKNLACNIRWSCYDFAAIKNAILYELGISVMSERLIRQEFKQGMLWFCDIEGGNFMRTFNLVYHKNKFLTYTIKEFIKACLEFGANENHGSGFMPLV